VDDDQLAVASARGDQEAFTVLMTRYRRHIYSIAYKITLNREDALDVTQNVLLHLGRRIRKYRPTGRFRSWAGVIAAREAIDFLRRPCHREQTAESASLERLSHEGSNRSHGEARQALEAKEQKDLVEEAMKGLSPQQRAIVTLQLSEDLGPAEIARHLGLRAKQVRSQLHRAIQRIRTILEREGILE